MRAGRIPRVPPVPSRRTGAGRSVGRKDPARVRALANVDGHPSLATLASRIGGSPYHFQRNFKRIVGVTPRQYAEACRLRKVKGRTAARQRRDERDVRRRLRIEQPIL